MDRLCLLLGFLCVVGCSASTTNSVTVPVTTTAAPTPTPASATPSPATPGQVFPTSAATIVTTDSSNTAAPSNAAAPSDTAAPSNTIASIVTAALPKPNQPTTQSLLSTTQLPQASSSQQVPFTATMKTNTPAKEETTSQISLGTTSKDVQVTSTPGTSDIPSKSTSGTLTPAKKDSTTGTSLLSTAAQATTPSPISPTVSDTSRQSLVTEGPKDNRTPGLNSSPASPLSGAVPVTTSSKTLVSIVSTKQTSGTSSSVPPTTAQSPVDSGKADNMLVVAPVVKYGDNIEVQCINVSGGKLVKIHLKASRICDNTVKPTKEEHSAFMSMCQAIMPGYQQRKDKCTIQLAYTDSDEVPIIEAAVATQLNPEDLYAKVKSIKKEDYSPLFSYESATLEDPDVVSIPLISAIVSLAVALLIIAAIYGCWHQKQTRKREQRLTEELQTMENGYHDNPTLEVMESAPEMQEKKGGPNGELGDSWIVPLDNLTGDELLDEEDTHL